MATVNTGVNNLNVSVQAISATTSTSGGSKFNVNGTYPGTGHALASPGALLTVQIGIENWRGDPNTCTIALTDSSSNNSFYGEAIMSWEEGDTSLAWVQFSDFPLQADQVTPVGECDYSLTLTNSIDGSSGTEVSAQVYTL